MYNDGDTTKHYWHIDQEYLVSIWNRIDAYNKGLERATTMKTSQALTIYRSCWVLLKNVYVDFSPFYSKTNESGVKKIKKDEDAYLIYMKDLKDLKKWFYSTPPSESEKENEWNKKIVEAVEMMDDCKMALIFAMAKQGSLLGTKFEPGTMTRIKGVMADW